MGDDEALLASVIASPSDDAPRLVYADWLDERADPRGEFIRLHFEIDRLTPPDDRYTPARTRLRDLRAGIDAGWLAKMGYPPRHRPLFAGLPGHRRDRWRLIEEFVEVWHRPLSRGDECSNQDLAAAERRLGVRLPLAVREWYEFGGRRADVWSRQDRLLAPDRLFMDAPADALVIRVENQGCERWGVRAADLSRDDPPVVEIGFGGEASPTVSAFACLTAVYEAQFAPGVLWAGGDVDPAVQAAAVRGLSRCDLPEQYWVTSPFRAYEGLDLIVQCHAGQWVYVSARTEQAYRRLPDEVRDLLEVYKS
jgi:uncharacterized protein (TIGR02996 family)